MEFSSEDFNAKKWVNEALAPNLTTGTNVDVRTILHNDSGNPCRAMAPQATAGSLQPSVQWR